MNPMNSINTLDWLAHQAQVSPEHVALIFEQQEITYQQLNDKVAKMAAQLAEAGVEAGQHVAMLMPNQVETVCLIHALARLGAVLVPLNVRLTESELCWQVNQADCLFVICTSQTEAQAATLAQSDVRVISVNLSTHKNVETLYDYMGEVEEWQSRPLDVSNVQGIIFTSGTTGHPKGAMLTFANHQASATASAFRLGTQPNDRWLACMPLYHVGGIAIIFRCCLYGTTVVLHNGFNLVTVNQSLANQQITLVSLVPTMLHRLLDTEKPALASSTSLRCILVGGAATTPALLTRCQALNLPLATTYGLTETTSQIVTQVPMPGGHKAGSVGKPLMFSAVRIIDVEGQPLPAGDIGEIVVSGPTVMQGYYKTKKIVHNGELHTGDMGYLDKEGDLWVVQRRADLIVSGGENVYPAEIEQVLEAHPAVGEVTVVGVADDEWGQKVVAAIVPKDPERTVTEEELVAFGREQLAGYKQPRMVRFIDKLPRTASGKVRRHKVKDWLE